MFDRDGERCRKCGRGDGLTEHHIVYRSQQGDDASYNLITLCVICHDNIHKGRLKILPVVEGERINADIGVRWKVEK